MEGDAMENISVYLKRAIEAVRSFLTDFYYISGSPGSARITEEEFHRDIKMIKEGRSPISDGTNQQKG